MPLCFFLSIPHLDSYTSSPLEDGDQLDFSQSDSAAAHNWPLS
jgi:hypothetical protein